MTAKDENIEKSLVPLNLQNEANASLNANCARRRGCLIIKNEPSSWIQAARGRTSRAIASPRSVRAFVRSCMACKFIQNSGLVPKKRAKRKAVSAVTARSPLTMAPMRVAGTRKAIAKALTDIANGLRNSSLSTSPGWEVTRLGVAMGLVVVDDFDIGRSFFGPSETDAPLIIDPDGVLSSTTAGQRL
jgi:hypothetical protein